MARLQQRRLRWTSRSYLTYRALWPAIERAVGTETARLGIYNDQSNELGGESGLGNTIAQAGLLGLLPLLWVRALCHDLAQAAHRRRDPGGPWLAMWLIFWLVSFLFSASSLGVGGNALGFMMLAMYLHPSWDGRAR